MNDFLLFGILPYVSLALFFLVTVVRYRMRTFSYSSLSSQFLENRQHFWGSVPFHYGILFVLAGHVLALFLPRSLLWWNSLPLRLVLLEVTGLAMAVLTLVGLLVIVVRRWSDAKVWRVTTTSDWFVYALLLVQVVTGLGVAVGHGWGSSWFATNLTPWLWSLARLAPEVEYVAPLPGLAKLHIINAFVLIGFFPFTRLVHVLVVPNHYLWRRTQVVRWNWDRQRIRQSD
jgi:nitrate reductase gamma subunit